MSAIVVKIIPTEIQSQGVDGGAPSKIRNIIIARINKTESRLGYARSNTFAKTPVEFESNGFNRKLNTNPMIIKPNSDETSTLISENPPLKNLSASTMLMIAGKYPAK
jgi:fructose-1-phosphate kinase PfkB-like protein